MQEDIHPVEFRLAAHKIIFRHPSHLPVLSGSPFGHVSRIEELAPIFSFSAIIIIGWRLDEYLSVYDSVNKMD